MKKLNQIIDAVGMMFIGFLFSALLFTGVIMRDPAIGRIMSSVAPESFIVTCQLNEQQHIYCTAKDIENE